MEWMRNSGKVQAILDKTPRTAKELRSALEDEFGASDVHMDNPVSTTRNTDAVRLRVPHLVGYYTEVRHYLKSSGGSYDAGLTLQQLLYMLRLTSCPHLMRNHFYLVLGYLGLLAPEVPAEISAIHVQSTNSSSFKKKYGPMPERKLLLKNVRHILPKYGVKVALTATGDVVYGNVNEIYRGICEAENLTIWTCQYMILLSNMIFSMSDEAVRKRLGLSWSHERKGSSGAKRRKLVPL